MKRFLTLLMMIVCTSSVQANTISPIVQAKVDSMRIALYGPGSTMVGLHQIGFFPERGDATRRLPPEKIDRANTLIQNIPDDMDGVLIGATTPTRIDPAYTKGSMTLDVITQSGFQQGRAQFVNDATGRRCVVTTQGISNDLACVYLMIVRRSPGTPSLVPGRFVTNVTNLQGLRDTLAQLGYRFNGHERRIKTLEQRPLGGLQAGDIGLSAFVGGATYMMADQVYNGLIIGFTYRYLDVAIEGFVGENLNDSRQMAWATPQDFLPRFSNNHFEGGAMYWAPPQPYGPGTTYHYRDGSRIVEPSGLERYGWYWKLGVTGAHLQRDNIENVSNLEAYYLGGVATVAWPLPFLTPEIAGTVGYCWTREAAITPNTAPSKSDGLGYGLRLTLVVGRR